MRRWALVLVLAALVAVALAGGVEALPCIPIVNVCIL